MASLDEATLAAQYGFAMAILNGNAELKSLFQQAVAQTWSPDRFTAAVRNTEWFKATSENRRNIQTLKVSDPASYQERLNRQVAQLQIMAGEMGATFASEDQLRSTAEHFLLNAYDDNQIRQALVDYVGYTDGRLLGQAGQWETDLRSYADKMGVTLSNDTILSYVRNAESGKSTIDDAKKMIANTSASAYPAFAERIRAGETVADVADPYRQTMASLLEVNPESVTIKDPTIQKALQSADKDGKPVLQTLYDFGNTIRQDSRWLKTKNAQDQAMSVTNGILRSFGVIS